jgi:uncharacterized protein
MALLERIQKDMVAAMKAKEEARLSTLRMMKAALMRYKVDTMKEIDESAEMQIMNSLIKQRHDSADMFRKGGRPEMADKEEAEIRQIESYMPSAPTDEEVEAAIESAMAETGATSAKQMGLVMKAAQAKLAGKRVDGKALSEKVRSKLS